VDLENYGPPAPIPLFHVAARIISGAEGGVAAPRHRLFMTSAPTGASTGHRKRAGADL